MPALGVNIDHIASIREIRHGLEPEPLFAALICQVAGADSVVAHLREDRRHIKEKDVIFLRKAVKTKLNLEMSCADDIVRFACKLKPDQATLVPERRQELTTEGGLDVAAHFAKVKRVSLALKKAGIVVSLFIDPERLQIDAARRLNVLDVELHTGRYAQAKTPQAQEKYFKQLAGATAYARAKGMHVYAGHGLDYYNVSRIAGIPGIEELNIGYAIICRAALVGLAQAVKEMKKLCE
ncbi:MAG TPA: pyridoxine 5'-phosphate synthase [Patescibacteria group bacterium]|nr:pyridoxine 5'-phosphate synthase [Patescibacteria group bacterium]